MTTVTKPIEMAEIIVSEENHQKINDILTKPAQVNDFLKSFFKFYEQNRKEKS